MKTDSTFSQRWIQAGVLVGFWTLIACIYITSSTVIYLTVGGEQPYTPTRALWTLLGWYTWIPSTLIVLALVRRFPLDRESVLPNTLLHLVAAPCVSLFASLLFTGMRGLQMWVQGDLLAGWFSETLSRVFFSSVTLDSVIYITILIGVHAFEYYRKFRERELRASQLEAELAEARLHALRLQLQPHFLFNTFHTIAMLVRQQRDEEAVDTIAVLSDFLRYVLDNTGAQEVSLQQELGFLESYLAIERIRFKDRLDVQMNIAPEALQACVPNLILQPLVENAIRHGIEPAHRPGRIEVVARREGDQLRLRVQDNGVGLPEDWHLDEQRGVGLANTKTRLARLYGKNHLLEFSNAPDTGGLMVTIVIPYHAEPTQPVAQPDATAPLSAEPVE